jgi:hypothetical protein
MPAQDPTTVKLLTLLNVSSLKSKRRSLKLDNTSGEGQPGDVSKRRKLGGKRLAPVEVGKDDQTNQNEEELESEQEEIEDDDGK